MTRQSPLREIGYDKESWKIWSTYCNETESKWLDIIDDYDFFDKEQHDGVDEQLFAEYMGWSE